MADSRFFHNAGAISLADIAASTGAVAPAAQAALRFCDVAPLEQAGKDDISFLDNTKYLAAFEASKAGACFVRAKFAGRAPAGMITLITEEPYYAYALAAQAFYPTLAVIPGVSPQAQVAASATLGKGVRVDAGAVIGERASIGNGCWIGANSVIGDGVEIGDGAHIGALCSVSHASIGARTILHRGVHIGQDGFGFAPGKKGVAKVPQLGRALIGRDVEIGSGTCIDRGAGPDTMVGDFCKIDNMVQIGHNVQIGRFTMIAAQTGIAGSTSIGDGVLIGGQVGIAGHLRIESGAKIAACSGVMTDIPAGAAYGGAPALAIREWHRQTATIAKIARKTSATEINE